jgi:hypothetical protein
MTGPAIFGDPIDPNEPISEPALAYYPYPWTGAHPQYPGYLSPPPGGYQPWDGLRPADERPGAVVTAAVLSLITAGLLLITGFVVIFAASSLETADTVDNPQRTTLFVGAGLVNVIAAALLIIGGVALLSRSRAGRSALVVGTLLCLALGAFWLIEDHDGGIIVWLFIFCAPALIAGLLACTARVTSWLGPARQ